MIADVTIHAATSTNPGLDEVLDLVRALSPHKRRALAEAVSTLDNVPHALVRLLAQDEISIAEPVIVHSPVLTDDDLCAVAALGSPAHVIALGARRPLSERVERALGGTGLCEARMIAFLRAGKQAEFAEILRALAGSNSDRALEALRRGDAGPMADLCRQADFRRATYSAIVLLVAKPVGNAETLLGVYDYQAAAAA
jgi:uncharacterized protein (DUF2336 family)